MTTKEFIPYESMGVGPQEGEEGEWWVEMMVAFAKHHVEAALKKASEEAMINFGDTTVYKDLTLSPGQLVNHVTIKANKASILNAYPLENIK